MDAPYAKLETLEPGVARVLAHNPSAFTYYGTQTYLVGEKEVAVIDPGPNLPEHVDALVAAIAGRTVVAIMCTHTHRDHSPAARPLSEAIGAPIVGCAPLVLDAAGPRADEAFDSGYHADRVLEDGESIDVDGRQLAALATPGHTSNHLCLALGDAVFTGDHVRARRPACELQPGPSEGTGWGFAGPSCAAVPVQLLAQGGQAVPRVTIGSKSLHATRNERPANWSPNRNEQLLIVDLLGGLSE